MEWVLNYAETVNVRRPERLDVFKHIKDHLDSLADDAPTVVELAPGPGTLGEVLLAAYPGLTYIGFDYSEPFIEVARVKLAPFGDRVTLYRADLNESDWPALARSPIHAVMSNMAIHDLGSETAVRATYQKAAQLLESGGLLINADLVTKPEDNAPPSDGKLKVPRHLEILTDLGLADVRCTLDLGHYACIVARK